MSENEHDISKLPHYVRTVWLTLSTDKETTYDWAVVLGGTNDLNMGQFADEIYEGLQKVWSIPLSTGTKVLALTVPECTCEPVTDDRRDDLNALILAHKAPGL